MTTDIIPLGFLALVACALAVWAVVAIARAPCSPGQVVLFAPAYFFVRCVWRAKVRRPFPLGPDEGAVVVSNHTSSADPFFVQWSCRKWMHWMVAREFTEHFLYGPLLRLAAVIAASRGGMDTAAMREAMRLASEGRLIGMFPEGRINMTGQLLLPVRPGAALIAMRAGVPIVPCYIRGAPFDRFPPSPITMPARVEIYFGDPIDPADIADSEDPQESVAGQLILAAARQIVQLAGHSELQPRLAGRNWKPSRDETLRAMEESVQRKRQEKMRR